LLIMSLFALAFGFERLCRSWARQ